MKNICELCLWNCKNEDIIDCDDFSPASEDLDIFDKEYIESLGDSYEEWMNEHGYHTDDEWFLDPQ